MVEMGHRDTRGGRKLQLCIIIITIRLWFSFSPLPHQTPLPQPSPARSATGSPAEEGFTIRSTQMHAYCPSAEEPCMVAYEHISAKLPETRLFLFLGILGQCLLAKPRKIPLRWSPYRTGWQSSAATCLPKVFRGNSVRKVGSDTCLTAL